MHFFVFILFGVHSACWIYRSSSFTKLQKFLALIFYFFFFFSSVFFLFLLGVHDVNIGSFVVSQISEVLFMFFFYSLFNCCSQTLVWIHLTHSQLHWFCPLVITALSLYPVILNLYSCIFHVYNIHFVLFSNFYSFLRFCIFFVSREFLIAV